VALFTLVLQRFISVGLVIIFNILNGGLVHRQYGEVSVREENLLQDSNQKGKKMIT